jgi:hypothetical protein
MLRHNLADFILLLKQKIGRVQSTISGSIIPKDAVIATQVSTLSAMVANTGKSPSV